ncbi:MAG: M20/M25/M40 family metallo-hydrolase, partial [Candidatus Saccharimonadales bacterium]
VVPAADEHFKLTKKAGKLYGRGVMDMKFAIASYMTLVDTLQGDLQAYDFGILITADEEIGGRNGAMLYANNKKLRPKVMITPDGGENWETETFAKGVQWIKLEATGKSSHASRPWEGESAITALLKSIHDIQLLLPLSANRKDTHLTVGTIEGGSVGNQIPVAASAMLDIRYGNMDDYNTTYPKLQALAKAHNVKATLIVGDPPCVNDIENPYIRAFRKLIHTTTGVKPGTSYSYGASDARYFSALGIPCIIVSPECGNRHQDGEWLSEKGFEQFCDIIEQYVRQTAALAVINRPPRTHSIKTLAQQLNAADKPAYVWYATYGSGLSKDNFMRTISGGQLENSTRFYKGCTDTSPPLRDTFTSLPYALYFGGECEAWGGGHVCVMPEPSPGAHTIARAYLVTVQQFEELAAQQNHGAGPKPKRLPMQEAMQRGRATIGDGTGDYEELLYCGTKDKYPMFTLTASTPRMPYVAPSPAYTSLVFKGLSENSRISKTAAIDYVYGTPGIAGNYQRQEITAMLQHITKHR